MIGKTLAHYEITSLLGKGGMGEVYQAKDTKLGRDVAIKVLPAEFAMDADRVARFQREAKLLASLNHPNIAAIYGLEESDRTNFLVMELIEGYTLADRIKSGPIPVEEALKLALQVTEALEAAHEKGVIHRDLKPANIKVTPEGKVKILDFGLAKAFVEDQVEMKPLDSPTISAAATQKGVILGTAAYMSPEQAKGKNVDKRADIWAFGCVLYEMLTGKAAFHGEDVSEILASVIKGDMKLDLLPENIHPRVCETISRCLKKDLNRRYQDIRDAQYEIEQVLADPGGIFVETTAGSEPRPKIRTILPWVAAALILGAFIAGVAVWKLNPPEPKQVMRFTYELPDGQQFQQDPLSGKDIQLAVSPDGNQFVYATIEGLYLRSVDALEARLIAGTDKNSAMPFFSPDGQWIGYISRSDHKLKKIALSGGAPVILCDDMVAIGASWHSDNTIVFSAALRGIMRVSADGGVPELLIKGDMVDFNREGLPVFPQMLPNGKALLFTNSTGSNADDWQVVIQSLKTGEREVLFKGIARRYLPTGHLVYSLENSLLAVPFDPGSLKITGGSVPVLEGVNAAAISNSGTLIYVSQPGIAAEFKGAAAGTAGASSDSTLVWADKQGKEEPLTAAPGQYSDFEISPDGTRVALAVATGGNEDIWIWDLARKTMTRLTFDEEGDFTPIWTPDSKRIVYLSYRENAVGGIFWKAADGTGDVEKLASEPSRRTVPSSWSKDGKTLALVELTADPAVNVDIGILSMDGDHARKTLLQGKHNDLYPKISPDGRWMAYQSDESGKVEVYVRPFPEVDKGKWQVSTDGGDSPLWSPDGRELFYHNGDSFMTVGVETDPTFKPGNPKILFKGKYLFSSNGYVFWDISPDGKRFLLLKPSASAGTAPAEAGHRPKINIVLNWFEELKGRVPVGQ